MSNEEAIKYLKQIYPNGGHCWLDEQRLEALSMAINALSKLTSQKTINEMPVVSYETTITADKTIPVLPMKEVFEFGLDYGDRVIVQIRKM